MKGAEGVVCAAVFLLLVLPRADAAPQTPAVLAEITAALSNNEARKAEQLSTTALADSGLSGQERSRLLLDRGLAREQLGEHGDALPDLTQAIEIHALPPADQALALFERGMALDALGRLPDALADYSGAIRLAPGSAPALNNRANVYRRLGKLEEARRDYLASLAAGNSQAEYPYFGLGQIAEAAGDTDAARGFYAKSVTANSSYRLAADRLNALGGPRENVVADGGVAQLRPPQDMPKDDAVPVTLKPPPAVPAVPPDTPLATVPVHLRARAARYERLALRPAIMGAKLAGPVNGPANGSLVQLGSWRAEAEATEGWNHALKRAGDDLARLTPSIVPVDLPGRGRYYRLRVTAETGAASLCAALAAKGLDCLAVRD